MIPAARGFSALLVLGALAVPYAQPVLCDQLMPAAMDEHAGHGNEDGMWSDAWVADMPAPSACVLTCLVAHVAPLTLVTPLTVPAPLADAGLAATARAASVSLVPTAPPPRS